MYLNVKNMCTRVCIQVDIVSESKLAMLNHKEPTQLARQLMVIMFTREELSMSSVTGRPSNKKSGQPVKPALDSARVNALICKLNHIH